MKVLVVDDSSILRQQIKRVLTAEAIEVTEARDGIDALERLAVTSDVQLVLCDVNMPRMDGLDFLEALRKDARWKTLPVVMLTTEAKPEFVVRAKALDAKGWIVKPFKAALLAATLKKIASAAA